MPLIKKIIPELREKQVGELEKLPFEYKFKDGIKICISRNQNGDYILSIPFFGYKHKIGEDKTIGEIRAYIYGRLDAFNNRDPAEDCFFHKNNF